MAPPATKPATMQAKVLKCDRTKVMKPIRAPIPKAATYMNTVSTAILKNDSLPFMACVATRDRNAAKPPTKKVMRNPPA